MSIKGSPYPRYPRALKTGNLAVIRNAASELPSVSLQHALTICLVIRDAEPERYERACLRWLARYCLERADTVENVRAAATALHALPADPEPSLKTLRDLVPP